MKHWRRYEESFWEKVKKAEGCWEWTGSKLPRGYGNFGRQLVKEHSQLAHRWAWRFSHGRAAPQNRMVLHSCDNPCCVRPSHLFLGTQTDNMRDLASKGKHPQSLKTHCPQGHPYSEGNTKIFRRPGRNTFNRACIICLKESRHRQKIKRSNK